MVTLINARFVPFYFDLQTSSATGDADAREFVVSIDAQLAGNSVPGPEMFIARPNREILGRLNNAATEDQCLKVLLEVVGGVDGLADETESESSLPAHARAWLRYSLGDTERARGLLADCTDVDSVLMVARIERYEQQYDAARAACKRARKRAPADAAIERALIEWCAGVFGEALAAFESVPHDHARNSEVEYHRGVVLFQISQFAAARAVWKKLIKRHGEDRWSYRADWALARPPESSGFGMISTGGAKSALGRHGYMGRSNPDLGK